MPPDKPAFVRAWRVGCRCEVTMTARKPERGQVVSASMEWSPDLPERLTESEIADYLRGRNAALAELAAELGGSAAVIDL